MDDESPAFPSALLSGAASADAASALLPGPLWSSGFVLRAPLALRSKSNFRRYRAKGVSGSWSEEQSFERSLGLLLRAARPSAWEVGDPAVVLAARPVVAAAIGARSSVDVANFSKSVLDAGQGVLYVSDASVLGENSVGVRGRSSELFVGFAQLPAGASVLEVQAALSALSAQVAVELSASVSTR